MRAGFWYFAGLHDGVCVCVCCMWQNDSLLFGGAKGGGVEGYVVWMAVVAAVECQ